MRNSNACAYEANDPAEEEVSDEEDGTEEEVDKYLDLGQTEDEQLTRAELFKRLLALVDSSKLKEEEDITAHWEKHYGGLQKDLNN